MFPPDADVSAHAPSQARDHGATALNFPASWMLIPASVPSSMPSDEVSTEPFRSWPSAA